MPRGADHRNPFVVTAGLRWAAILGDLRKNAPGGQKSGVLALHIMAQHSNGQLERVADRRADIFVASIGLPVPVNDQNVSGHMHLHAHNEMVSLRMAPVGRLYHDPAARNAVKQLKEFLCLFLDQPVGRR